MTKKKDNPQYFRVKADAKLTDLPDFIQQQIEKLLISEKEASYKDGRGEGYAAAQREAAHKQAVNRENAPCGNAPLPDPLEMASKIRRNLAPYDAAAQNVILNSLLFTIKQDREMRAQYCLVRVEERTNEAKAMHADAVLGVQSLKNLLA